MENNRIKYKENLMKINLNYFLDLILIEDGEKFNAIAPKFKPYNLAYNVKYCNWKLSYKQRKVLADIYVQYIFK